MGDWVWVGCRVELSQQLVETGVIRRKFERVLNPTTSLSAAAEGETFASNCRESRRIVTPGWGSGVPDEPFQAVLRAGELGMRAGCRRVADQPECLAKPEPRIAVVGGGLERTTKVPDRPRGIAST